MEICENSPPQKVRIGQFVKTSGSILPVLVALVCLTAGRLADNTRMDLKFGLNQLNVHFIEQWRNVTY